MPTLFPVRQPLPSADPLPGPTTSADLLDADGVAILVDRIPVFEQKEDDLAGSGSVDEEVVGQSVARDRRLVPVIPICGEEERGKEGEGE